MWKSIQHNDAHGPFAVGYGNGKETSIDLPTSKNPTSETGTGPEPAPMNGYGHAGNHATPGPQPYPGT